MRLPVLALLLALPVAGQTTVSDHPAQISEQKTEDFAELRAKAEQGDAVAEFNLGDCYRQGQGVPQDRAEAVKWYLKAAEQGNASAQESLGVCYYQGQGVPQDYTEAVKWLRKAAEQGFARAQFNLGLCYAKGDGVPQDHAEAVTWYRKAAEQGFASAQINLGFLYENGQGVPQDFTEAVNWYRKAAEQGIAGAQSNLANSYFTGQGVTKDFVEGIKWYRRAAEQGFAQAQFNLGNSYFTGQGVPKDYAEALKWYRKAAAQGDAYAQYSLGQGYYNGRGISRDLTQAAKWYQKAADQGNPDAQLALGDCYAKGKGVKKDYNEAVKWYMKSAEQENPHAQVNIGQDFAYGWGLPKDPIEAEKWFRKSADQGYAEAQHQLFYWYSQGVFVSKDEDEAMNWCRKAAEQGHAEAQYDLGSELEVKGLQINQDALLDAYAWFCLAAANGHKHAALSRDSLARNLYPQALVKAKARAQELFLKYPPRNARNVQPNPVSSLTTPTPPLMAKASPPLTKLNSKRPPVPGATENQQGLWEADMDLGQCRMLMVLIPTGSFMMVTPSTGDFVDNKPDHKVTISRRFWMGKYDVTQAQWEAVMGSNPSHFRGADLPVEQVSWDDCQMFISRLNAKGKGSFRLPTEAEWEYACLAGTTDDLFNFSSIAWFEENSGGGTNPVGTKEPNAFGLCDMVGNVCQWCQDTHQSDTPTITMGPQKPMTGPLRVVRGSDWKYSLTLTHMAVREGSYTNPDSRSSGLGFRLLRTTP